jgi:hypothetical protein
VPGGGGIGSLSEQGAFGSNQRIANHARNIAVSETHLFSAKLLNQASFGYDRIFDYIPSQGTGTCASAKLGIPGANLGCTGGTTPTCAAGAYSCGLVSTEFTNGGYWALGDRGYSPFQGGTDIFFYKDALDLILRKHELRMGIDFRANQMNVGSEAFADGFWLVGVIGNLTGNGSSVAGNSEADFLLGYKIAHPSTDGTISRDG